MTRKVYYKKKEDLKVGMKYNHLTIISEELEKSKDGHLLVRCRCDCGKEKLIAPYRLFNIKPISCRSCANKRKDYPHEGIGEITRVYFHTIKSSAKRRNLEFSITMEDMWSVFLKQNRKCRFTGTELTFSRSKKTGSYSPDFSKISASLDRIDSNKGYTIDNIQWVHKTVNVMKSSLSDKSFIGICKLIANYNDNFEPSYSFKEGKRCND